jgi:hypothetical protein
MAPDDIVATLGDFVRLRSAKANFVDAAVAAIEPGVPIDGTRLRGLGRLAGVRDTFLDEGARVAKIGRTTGLTRGQVTAFEMDNVVVEFDIGLLRFDNVIEIEGQESGPFSRGGDSGSLIVGMDRRGVGLLLAGSGQGAADGQGLTYATPLRSVLEALRIQLVH